MTKIEDIKIKVIPNHFGNEMIWNIKVDCEEELFKGAVWIETRSFYTELEAKIAANVCESILDSCYRDFIKKKKEMEEKYSDIKLPFNKSFLLKEVDFPIRKWKILTRSIFYMLDTPNKDRNFE